MNCPQSLHHFGSEKSNGKKESDRNSAESFTSTSGISFVSRGLLYPIANTGFIQENDQEGGQENNDG
ncbi:hypothetical protein EJB05_40532 [Eragrostis curvula]|uniref:Uncharacterized protein n=1 Tax=Eragrostis curvula TaxID=38414 RepID=A0A5J9TQ64_9POAL|nr:hypothetical protein EJB05_40532 [Eragrostis curvula]